MREFKVGDKVVSEEFGEGVVINTGSAHIYETIVLFDSARQSFTRDGFYYLNNNEPCKNIKHKEENTMKKSDLKTGMVVEYKDGQKRIVLKDGGFLVGAHGFAQMSGFNEDMIHVAESSMSITKVYGIPERPIDYINPEAERDLIWQREEVKEMTVSEISKALGYTVKVVE